MSTPFQVIAARAFERDARHITRGTPGMGQWRIRQGDYRLRYDIFRREVVLFSIRHRREAY